MTTGLVPALYCHKEYNGGKMDLVLKQVAPIAKLWGTDTLIRSLGNIVTNA